MGKKKGKKGNDGDAAAAEAAPLANATRVSPSGAAARAQVGFEPSQSAYEVFATEARAVDKRDLVKMRGDAKRAFHNAQLAVSAVFAHETEVRAELPRVDIDALRALPDLARAAAYAAECAKRAKPGASDGLEKRARDLRKLLLKSASALAEAGLIPDRDLEKFRRVKGQPQDLAAECLELAGLFRTHAGDVKGKTPVSVQQLHEAADVGAELAKRKNGNGAMDTAGAAEMRDRLWTLLRVRHDKLWRVAAYLFGRKKADKRVPRLDARVRRKKLAAMAS